MEPEAMQWCNVPGKQHQLSTGVLHPLEEQLYLPQGDCPSSAFWHLYDTKEGYKERYLHGSGHDEPVPPGRHVQDFCGLKEQLLVFRLYRL